ncbi:MAG: hypothetical protein GTN43_02930, partial [Candidatus Aenigmarchaeota archaeon]|nr:hypothetical protein [Candidatus Aenigmarchaeota archaeon]
VNEIKDELIRQREHVSNQISKCHARIDDVIEKHHTHREEMKERDVKLEKRIGVVGTVAAAIIYTLVELIKVLIPFIGKAIK